MANAFKKSRADYPLGILAIYDNGGRTADRYCVVFTPFSHDGQLVYNILYMSSCPTQPQGVASLGETRVRPTRGKGEWVISFDSLPEECRKCAEACLDGREIECPHCGGMVPELVASGPHAGERCRVCVSH